MHIICMSEFSQGFCLFLCKIRIYLPIALRSILSIIDVYFLLYALLLEFSLWKLLYSQYKHMFVYVSKFTKDCEIW